MLDLSILSMLILKLIFLLNFMICGGITSYIGNNNLVFNGYRKVIAIHSFSIYLQSSAINIIVLIIFKQNPPIGQKKRFLFALISRISFISFTKLDPCKDAIMFCILFLSWLLQLLVIPYQPPIKDEEVCKVVFQLESSKAPCPDSFSSLFYQHHQHIVGPSLCSVVHHFHKTRLLL